MVSPLERLLCPIFKIGKAIKEGRWETERLEAWKDMLLTCAGEFKLLSERDEFRWESIQIREDLGLDFEAGYRSAVDQIFEIAVWKINEERTSGTTLSAKSVAEAYKNKVPRLSLEMSV